MKQFSDYKHLASTLQIPQCQIKPLSSRRFVCLVTDRWLQHLVQGKLNDHITQESLQESQCQQYLALSMSTLPDGWQRVMIQCIEKSSAVVNSLSDNALYHIRPDLSLPELLIYISKENKRNLWQENYHKFSGQTVASDLLPKQQFDGVMRTLLHRFHPYSMHGANDSGSSATNAATNNTRLSAIYNITHIYSVYETQGHFYIVQPCIENCLQDVVNYSPAVFDTSNARILFVIFQLLHILRTFHERGLSVGDLRLSNIRIDSNLWLYLSVPCLKQIPHFGIDDSLSSSMSSPQISSSHGSVNVDADHPSSNEIHGFSTPNTNKLLNDARAVLKQCSYTKFTFSDLPRITDKWLKKEFTNFKYLMILNHLAGRRMCDPNNHPVLPWVINFGSPEDDYRDLTMSKYRINKGDRQLDTMYETIPMTLSDQLEPNTHQIPHHISDVLSDITYYLYKARQTPKELLCKYVRTKWVPNEYPSNMQRLQQWTPDECIPEFFTDPDIFVSIHDDLPDLDVPPWCCSPDDFIRKHMEALESDYVSEHLHHWIDLTFGCKLSGDAAVEAKNVYLHLVDGHCTVTNHGVMQLFQTAHPYRITATHLLLPKSPKIISTQIFSTSTDEDQVVQMPPSSYDVPVRVDAPLIQLPPMYDPMAALNHLEAAYMYTQGAPVPLQTAPQMPVPRKTAMVYRDLQCLACAIMEMFYAPKLRLQPSDSSLKQRYVKLRQVYNQDRSRLPRPVRHAVVQLLKLHTEVCLNDDADDLSPLFLYDSISCDGLPPPNPSLLLNIHTDLFPFPACFPSLFECLCTLRIKDLAIEQNQLSDKSDKEKLKVTKILSREKVLVLEEFLRKHHTSLSREVIDIVLPYVEDMFNNSNTAVQAAWHLFGVLAQALGPVETRRIFLPHLTRLLSGEDSTPKHMKLFHRTFLLQMIIRMGLAAFLKSFSTLLVEAVAGYKDFDIYTDSDAHTERVTDLQETTEEILSSMASVQCCEDDDDDDAAQRNALDEFSEDIDDAADAVITMLEADANDADAIQFDDDFPDNISLGEGDNTCASDSENASQVSTMSDNSVVDTERLRKDSDDQRSLHSISHLLEVSGSQVDSVGIEPGSSSDDTTPEPGSCIEDEACDVTLNDHRERLPVFHENIHEGDGNSKLESAFTTDELLVADDGVMDGISEPCVASNDENINDAIPDTNDISSPEGKTDELTSMGSTHSDRIPEGAVSSHEGIGFRSMIRSETDEFTTLYNGLSTENLSNICDVAFNSVKWLSHRLGPLLAAKYLSRNLIRMMALCYLGPEQMQVLPDNDSLKLKSSKLIYGDKNASRVLEGLGVLVTVYGESMVRSQYLPAIVDMVSVAQKRLTARTEASVIGCLVLLRSILYYITDKSLMDILQDNIIGEILIPLLKLATGRHVSFPSGAYVRSVVCHKIIDVIYIIGLRIGFEMTRKHLTVLLHKFFATFDALYAGAISPPTDYSSPIIKTPNNSSTDESYLNIHIDSVTQEYSVGTPVILSPLTTSPRSTGSMRGKNYTLTSTPFDDKDDATSGSASKETITDELLAVFSPELAYCSYLPFCRIFGSSHIEQNLLNDEMIRHLSAEHDQFLAQQCTSAAHGDHTQRVTGDSNDSDDAKSNTDEDSGANIAPIGNRLQIQMDTSCYTPDLSHIGKHYKASGLLNTNPETLQCPEMGSNKHRHLRGNWLAYWEHELGLSDRDDLFNFKQIKLQTFQGHKSSIRSMCVMDGENSFISASKDKTVRLWSLRNFSDGSGLCKCQWIYQRHKKSVFSVTFVERYRQVASCDTTVHVWDPFTGVPVRQFEASRNNPVMCMVAVPAPSTCLLTALSDATLRLLDLRTANYSQEYRCTTQSSGVIRTVAVSGDAASVGVGYSSGIVSTLDLRTGMLLNTWKGHDSEIHQMKFFNKSSFVTSSFDQIKLWSVDEGKELCAFKGASEPVHSFSFYRNQIISATTANRIGVHSAVDASASFTSSRLRSDTFKGLLTCMSVLPINRTLLLGADNGIIKLLC